MVIFLSPFKNKSTRTKRITTNFILLILSLLDLSSFAVLFDFSQNGDF